LNKNSDLTQDKEKPTVEEISASSVDKIVPDIEHVSNDMAEQQSSSAGGQDKKKKADNKSTGLTGHGTGLTGAPSKSGNSSKIKTRPSFKELLAKYEKEGSAQRQKGRPSEIKDTGSSSRHQEQSSQGCQFTLYSLGRRHQDDHTYYCFLLVRNSQEFHTRI